MTKLLTKDQMHQFFATLQALNPEPVTELNYTNAFTLLVAVVLSAQATDKGVNKATEKLFQIADTPEKMLALGVEGVKEHIKTIGLFNTKAKNVIKLCEDLIEHHNSQVPGDRDALVKLAGVGRKTANVVLNSHFKLPTMPVDTHIFRVSNRVGLGKGKTVDAVEKALLKRIPEEYLLHAHHWIILHGRYICKAQKPQCSLCPVVEACNFKDKNLP